MSEGQPQIIDPAVEKNLRESLGPATENTPFFMDAHTYLEVKHDPQVDKSEYENQDLEDLSGKLEFFASKGRAAQELVTEVKHAFQEKLQPISPTVLIEGIAEEESLPENGKNLVRTPYSTAAAAEVLADKLSKEDVKLPELAKCLALAEHTSSETAQAIVNNAIDAKLTTREGKLGHLAAGIYRTHQPNKSPAQPKAPEQRTTSVLSDESLDAHSSTSDTKLRSDNLRQRVMKLKDKELARLETESGATRPPEPETPTDDDPTPTPEPPTPEEPASEPVSEPETPVDEPTPELSTTPEQPDDEPAMPSVEEPPMEPEPQPKPPKTPQPQPTTRPETSTNEEEDPKYNGKRVRFTTEQGLTTLAWEFDREGVDVPFEEILQTQARHGQRAHPDRMVVIELENGELLYIKRDGLYNRTKTDQMGKLSGCFNLEMGEKLPATKIGKGIDLPHGVTAAVKKVLVRLDTDKREELKVSDNYLARFYKRSGDPIGEAEEWISQNRPAQADPDRARGVGSAVDESNNSAAQQAGGRLRRIASTLKSKIISRRSKGDEQQSDASNDNSMAEAQAATDSRSQAVREAVEARERVAEFTDKLRGYNAKFRDKTYVPTPDEYDEMRAVASDLNMVVDEAENDRDENSRGRMNIRYSSPVGDVNAMVARPFLDALRAGSWTLSDQEREDAKELADIELVAMPDKADELDRQRLLQAASAGKPVNEIVQRNRRHDLLTFNDFVNFKNQGQDQTSSRADVASSYRDYLTARLYLAEIAAGLNAAEQARQAASTDDDA